MAHQQHPVRSSIGARRDVCHGWLSTAECSLVPSMGDWVRSRIAAPVSNELFILALKVILLDRLQGIICSGIQEPYLLGVML